MTIYLDHNATTPLTPEVAAVLHHASLHLFGNPSSVHAFGRESRAKLTEARHQIAGYFRVRPQEIVFYSCATESLNTLIQGVPPGAHIMTSVAEHACVIEAVKAMQARGCTATFIPVGAYGAVQPEAVLAAIQPQTRLIALMAVNNETGVKTDIKAIGEIARQHRIPFVVDGVAWLGKEVFEIPEGVSAICFSGHKIHAPKGIGFAIQRPGYRNHPLLYGGGQESGRRAGTENVPGILALAKAIELLKECQEEAISRMTCLRERLEEGLLHHIPGALINGTGPRICNTTNLSFPEIEGESLLMALDLEGIAVSHGSACAAGGLEPSRVLLAMGLSRSIAASALRFSLSRFTTEQEIDRTIERVVYHYRKLRS